MNTLDALQQIKGQEHAKRALEVALVQGHPVLLQGPPGNGKTMLKMAFEPFTSEDSELLRVYETWPCSCGFFGHPGVECQCTVRQVKRFTGNLRSLILRKGVAIFVEVPGLSYKEYSSTRMGESLQFVLNRVMDARKNLENVGESIDSDGHRLLEMCCDRLCMSPRSISIAISVARSIAALDGSNSIRSPHLSEAIQYQYRSTQTS